MEKSPKKLEKQGWLFFVLQLVTHNTVNIIDIHTYSSSGCAERDAPGELVVNSTPLWTEI